MSEIKDFGNLVRRLRLERRWTQAELAGRLHISRAMVSLIESGRRTADREMMKALALTFNRPIEEFLVAAGYLPGGTGQINEQPPAYAENGIGAVVEASLRADPDLDQGDVEALLRMYRTAKRAKAKPPPAETGGSAA